MHIASEQGHSSIVEYLLQLNDLTLMSMVNSNGQTAAMVSKYVQIESLFEKSESYETLKDSALQIAKLNCNQDQCCSFFSRIKRFPQTEIMKLAHEKDPKTQLSLVSYLCHNGHSNGLEFFLKMGLKDDEQEASLLWRAANSNQVNILRLLNEYGFGIRWIEPSQEGTNSLEIALAKNHLEIIKLFLELEIIPKKEILLSCVRFGLLEIINNHFKAEL